MSTSMVPNKRVPANRKRRKKRGAAAATTTTTNSSSHPSNTCSLPLLEGCTAEDLWARLKKPRVPTLKAATASYCSLHASSLRGGFSSAFSSSTAARHGTPGKPVTTGSSNHHYTAPALLEASLRQHSAAAPSLGSIATPQLSRGDSPPGVATQEAAVGGAGGRAGRLSGLDVSDCGASPFDTIGKANLLSVSANVRNMKRLVDRRRRSDMKDASAMSDKFAAPPGLPFDRATYEIIHAAFTSFDKDGTARLTWSQLQTLAGMSHLHADYKAFKRLDRDRSGLLDFEDTLRLFYPKTKGSDIKWVLRAWGGEALERVEERQTEVVRGESLQMTAEALEELQGIFNLYASMSPGGGGGGGRQPWGAPAEKLGKMQMMHALRHSPPITEPDINHIYSTYAVTEADALTFPEFANLMQSVCGGVNVATTIQYSYATRPPPMPEL